MRTATLCAAMQSSAGADRGDGLSWSPRTSMLRKCALGCLIAGLAAAANLVPAGASTVPLPNTMSSTGDSITRGFDANGSCVLHDCPQLSWSTGTDASVNSQYSRLLALNPGIAGHEYNVAK